MPTEHRADLDAERRHKSERRAWIEEMHRTAPGVDWRAIERQNGLDRMERRRAAAQRAGISPWTEVGSRNLAGRMHATALSADGDSLYGGSSLGGVWKADLNGNGWRPLHDNLYGGSHGLAVAAGPPETITSITDGGLIHWTEDGGQTWTAPALTNVTGTKRVRSDANDPNRIWLVLTKNSAQRKLYRSDDRGQSYVLKRSLSNLESDIWIDRQVGGRLYLLQGNVFYKTDDGGDTFDLVGTIPIVTPSGVVLAGSEAGSPTFYAAVVEGGGWKLWRSTDGGVTWAYRHDIGDFWQTLAASITDPDVVMFGGVELHRSTDGGASFSLVNGWGAYYDDPLNKLHADLPGLDVVWTAQGQEIHYIATDGGLYRSDDRVASVTNISMQDLGVSQYYTTHTSVNDPTIILAGAQDQGYQRSTGPPIGTLRDFDQLISGDYGHLTSSDGTHEKIYSDYPGFILVQEGELSPSLPHLIDFPAGSSHSWLPYILAKPGDPDVVYLCADRIYRYRDAVPQWSITPTTQDFTVAGGSYLTALLISPVDPDRKMAITDTGVIWYTDQPNFNNFVLSPDTGPSSHYFYGTALEPSPTDALVAYAGGSGYSGPAVYRTTDGGVTWTPVSNGLPSTLVYDLAFEQTGSGAMYAATEAGPYRLDPGTDTWTSLDHAELPLTRYWCVEAVPASSLMRFGTYGRGIWDYHYGTATSLVELEQPFGDAHLRIASYPNPFVFGTTVEFTTTRPGDANLRIYDVGGRLVRELANGPVAPGDHRTDWDGRDGHGRRVAAGVYLVRLETPDSVATRRITRLR
jgi:photosystem II stability/assembly factor-like uncharacterized protein